MVICSFKCLKNGQNGLWSFVDVTAFFTDGLGNASNPYGEITGKATLFSVFLCVCP